MTNKSDKSQCINGENGDLSQSNIIVRLMPSCDIVILCDKSPCITTITAKIDNC